PADLVKDDKAFGCRIPEDVGSFGHLHHEGRLPPCQVVRCPHPRENPVRYANDGCRCRDKAAHLSHQRNQRHLPHEGGFACHVRPGNDKQLVAVIVKLDVVRHKTFPKGERLDHRMTAICNGDGITAVYLGSAVSGKNGDFCKRQDHVDYCDIVGGSGNPSPFRSHKIPHLRKSEYSSSEIRSSAPSTFSSYSFSSGVMNLSALARVCRR